MNALRSSYLKFLSVLLVLGWALAAQNAPAEDTYPVRILIEPRPDAKFYQIEWLETEEGDKKTGRLEKVTKTEIRRNLPVRYRYFRLRSAYRDGLYGRWGDVVEILRPVKTAQKPTTTDGKTTNGKPTDKKTGKNHSTDKPSHNGVPAGPGAKPVIPQEVFAQVIDREGKPKWVLRGSSVSADKLDQNESMFYDVVCLTETDAPENTNARKKYEGPVSFTRPGQYRMNLYSSDDPAKTEPLQSWTFWVYTDVPRTNAKFYAPFLHGRGGFIVGGKTKIALWPQFSPVVVDKTEYRIYKEGVKPCTWKKYEDEIEVNSFAPNAYGIYTIEFQTTNVAGNTEPPQLRRMFIDSKGPVAEETPAGLSFRDENYPIIVRIYQDGRLIQDKYFKSKNAQDILAVPAVPGLQIKAIDLLGNETILNK